MAGLKRPLDAGDVIKEKKRKVQGLNQNQLPVKTVKLTKVGQPTLPSSGEESVGGSSTESLSHHKPESRSLASRKSIPTKAKVSKSLQKGAGLPSGN